MSQAAAKFASAALDLENMIPKKANWELKRSLKPRLDILERRTQRALAELARLAAQKQGDGVDEGAHLARTVAAAEITDSGDEDE